MVIPNFMRQALLGEPLSVWRRQPDPLFRACARCGPALIGLLEGLEPGQVFNVGSQEEISMKALAEKIVENRIKVADHFFLTKAYVKASRT
jgi:nucleoside-diphosphate-sugar epimerase